MSDKYIKLVITEQTGIITDPNKIQGFFNVTYIEIYDGLLLLASIGLHQLSHATKHLFDSINEENRVEIFYAHNESTELLPQRIASNLIRFMKQYIPENITYSAPNFCYDLAYGRGVFSADECNYRYHYQEQLDAAHLKSGDIVHLYSLTEPIYHFALYLGQGNFLSMYGVSAPLCITSLDAMKQYWRAQNCSYAQFVENLPSVHRYNKCVKIVITDEKICSMNIDSNTMLFFRNAFVEIHHQQEVFKYIFLSNLNDKTKDFFKLIDESYEVEIFNSNKNISEILPKKTANNLIYFLKNYRPNAKYCCIHFAFDMAYGPGTEFKGKLEERYHYHPSDEFDEKKLNKGDVIYLSNSTKGLWHFAVYIGQGYYMDLRGISPLRVSTLADMQHYCDADRFCYAEPLASIANCADLNNGSTTSNGVIFAPMTFDKNAHNPYGFFAVSREEIQQSCRTLCQDAKNNNWSNLNFINKLGDSNTLNLNFCYDVLNEALNCVQQTNEVESYNRVYAIIQMIEALTFDEMLIASSENESFQSAPSL